jgi:F-type H+-transporting ATPase subunit alpha
MKKNAGKMKLAMAQYRELESFAQFDSDLDHDTKKTIERGKRTAEMLKQGQGTPLRVALQVASVYAVNNGFLDHVATHDVSAWEASMHAYMLAQEAATLEAIEGGWDDAIEASLKKALESFSANHK